MSDSKYFLLLSMVIIAPTVSKVLACVLGLVWFACAIFGFVDEMRAK